MIRAVETFAVTQSHSNLHRCLGVCKFMFLLAFHCNCVFLEFNKIARLKICNREQVSISFLFSPVPIVSYITIVTVYLNYCT